MSAPLDYEGIVTLDPSSKTWRGHIAIATHLDTGYLVADGFLKRADDKFHFNERTTVHAGALIGSVTSAEWTTSPDGFRRVYEFSGALFDGAESGTFELGLDGKTTTGGVPRTWVQALSLGPRR